MKYFAVTAQFGHVGRNKYIPKTIAVVAESGKEAAEKVRWMPRVKHHRKDAILQLKSISREEYLMLKQENRNDLYFKVSSKQEQETMCPELKNMVVYCEKADPKQRKVDRTDKIHFKMKKNKILVNEFMSMIRNYDAVAAI